MKKKSQQTKQHPLAVAWNEWKVIGGKGSLDFDSLTRGPYLENRLWCAFTAGWDAALAEGVETKE